MPRSTRQPTAGITAALIYTRVSGDEQEHEGLSLPAQLADCRRSPSSTAGSSTPNFKTSCPASVTTDQSTARCSLRVRRLRARGQNAVVAVKRLHRLGRRVSERVRCWEELDTLGVPIHSVDEGGVVLEVVANILASIAQEES